MNQQTLIIIVVILLVAAGGYFYVTGGQGDLAGVDGQAASISTPDIQRIEAQIAELRRLKTLELDTSILKNPFLLTLTLPATPPTTGTTTTPSGTPGRPNPFLPL
ncbi:MAG: hypothetical protein HY006_02595 [Candidatus Sungbacteria bacterium]|nr:hypothetical protein [Candidatus Sungbacteria bacterium]